MAFSRLASCLAFMGAEITLKYCLKEAQLAVAVAETVVADYVLRNKIDSANFHVCIFKIFCNLNVK